MPATGAQDLAYFETMHLHIRFFQRLANWIVLGGLVCSLHALPPAVAAPAPPKASVQSVVATRKQRAAKLAAAGKYALALEEVSKARERVRDAISTSGAAHPRPKYSAAYVQDMQKLRKWYAERLKKSPKGRGDAALTREYSTRMAALRKKHGPAQSPQASAALLKDQRRRIAQLMLMMGDLEELSATYHTRKKDTDQAQIYKIQAWTTRLDAQRIIGNAAGATKAADTLLRLNPPDPGVYNRIGRYYQGAGQYPKAANVWSRGIRLLESGNARLRTPTGSAMSAQNRNQLLGEFYRELAFCYAKTGRNSESAALIRKAAAAEASARRP